MQHFGEILTAMVTPFDQASQIDWSAVGGLIEHLLDNGTDTLVVAGSTGESATLSVEEKVELFRHVVQRVNGRAKVIAGTGSNNTAATIALTKAAEDVGVDGAMLVAPYYNKPPQDALYAHFAAVARATSLPLLIYNVPSRTGCNILPATIARLAEISNIFGVKEASGNLDQVSEIARLVPDDFVIYSGDDSLTLPILVVGGKGVVSVASHVIGKQLKQMVKAYLRGDVWQATAIHQQVFPVCKALFVTTNPIPLKAALNMLGVPVGGLRLPLLPLGESDAAVVRAALEGIGLL
jgi:4-hydroxy-tetrahydrodipicolinate synthase